MPDKVQSGGGRQLDEILRTAFDRVKGGIISGLTWIKKDTPEIRLTGTEASAGDWRLIESAGELLFQENDGGTEEEPAWVTRFTINSSGGS